MISMPPFVEKYRWNILLGLTLVALLAIAWYHHFIQDDAFISFRYAENLVSGKGLVWNPGEKIEGYTNFLWTILIAAGMLLRINPIGFSFALGHIFLVVSLILTYKTANLLLPSRSHALLTVILLGLNYTFSSYATGGLETQMQTSLLLACCFLAIQSIITRHWGTRRLVTLSSISALALLTRLDSSLICTVVFCFSMWYILRENTEPRRKVQSLLLLLGPFAFVIGAWFVWKLTYYGNILPNSFYIKVATGSSLMHGLEYLYLFGLSYFLLPFPLIGFVTLESVFKNWSAPIALLLCIVLLWLGYVVKIGGDFMEFRFLVPILPMFFILIVWMMDTSIKDGYLRASLILLIVIGNLHHAYAFDYDPDHGIEPIHQLNGHLFDQDKNWIGIGKALGAAFEDDTSITIATTAAGAIPYYSRLKTVDMLGINDKWIATSGYFIGFTPGHQRIAPFDYLVKCNVNIVISHPLVLSASERVRHVPFLPGMQEDALSKTKVLEIPLDSVYRVIGLYLTPNPSVDQAIRKNGWAVREVSAE